MFEYISGTLVEKQPVHAVVDVGGIGYSLSIPLSTYESLPAKGAKVKLLTHLSVREDDMSLYGFASKSEIDIFRLLLGVSGIGPKLALGILSGTSTSELRRAVVGGDVSRLTAIKGVGTKTAQRLIVELKDKFGADGKDFDWMTGEPSEEVSVSFEEATAALVALGFKHRSALQAVKKSLKSLGEEAAPEELVRESLRNI